MSRVFSDLQYFVGLNKIGLGAKTFSRLMKKYQTVRKLWYFTKADLIQAGLQSKTADKLLQRRKQINLKKELQKILNQNLSLLTLLDKKYPSLLKEIDDPPYILFYKGKLDVLSQPAIAVVGTRKMTLYGKRVCEKIVSGLARNGINIVSGLALGIDAISHKTALANGGVTTAVLGTSLDFIYPLANYQLAQKISQNGMILSEFPLGTCGHKSNFPLRNRIISGLSLGTLVIEAADKSGALITANFALNQNREVFAVPGSIFSPQSTGCNNLIKMGAKAVSDYSEILDELNLKNKIKESPKKISFESETEKEIWNLLDFDKPVQIDTIVKKIKKPVSEISSILTLMEIKKMIKNLGAQQYVKK